MVRTSAVVDVVLARRCRGAQRRVGEIALRRRVHREQHAVVTVHRIGRRVSGGSISAFHASMRPRHRGVGDPILGESPHGRLQQQLLLIVREHCKCHVRKGNNSKQARRGGIRTSDRGSLGVGSRGWVNGTLAMQGGHRREVAGPGLIVREFIHDGGRTRGGHGKGGQRRRPRARGGRWGAQEACPVGLLAIGGGGGMKEMVRVVVMDQLLSLL